MPVTTPERTQSADRTRQDEEYARSTASVIDEPSMGIKPVNSAHTAGGSLVVLDPDTPSTTLRAALQRPDVSKGITYLLAVFPTAEYEARRRARFEAGVIAPYTIEHLEAEARRIADRTGHEWLDPTGVAFEPIGAVGRLRDYVRTIVEEQGCTRVYVTAPRRTLWQRLLGAENSLATLAGVLPPTVTVVPVEGTFESGVSVIDTGVTAEGLAMDDPKAIADAAVTPDPLIEK